MKKGEIVLETLKSLKHSFHILDTLKLNQR